MTSESLRRRTVFSFFVFGLFLIVLVGGWLLLTSSAEEDDVPPGLRRVLELNGRLWSPPSSSTNVRPAPPVGRIPRTNGDVGLMEGLDPEQWHLEVIADDQNPSALHLQVSLKDIQALPRTETASEFRCIEGWSEDMSFAGVKFKDFMRAYNLSPKKYVGLVSVDGEYYVSIDIESMEHEQTLLAYEMNGQPLRSQNGAPLRLFIPVKYGIKNLKQIGKIFFSDVRPPDYWAERGYDWYAGL